jgi:hypothetical protein
VTPEGASGGRVRRSRLVFGVLLLLLSHLAAEEIHLKDGTKIEGKLIGVSDTSFAVQTTFGNINVPRADVLSIAFPENQPKGASTQPTTLPPVAESLVDTTYTNQTGNFRLTLPLGWLAAPEMRKGKEVVASLKSPDATLFLLVTPEVFPGTLATYKVLAEMQYQSKFTEYQKVSESEAKLDGRKGIRLVFQGRPDKGTTVMKCLVYIVPYEGRMVRLSFLTLEPLFNDAVPTFEKIAGSYRSIDSSALALK